MLGYTVPSACWDRHGYCCRWYASYWNASLFYYYYHLQLSCKGYVFTHVCHSVHGGGAIPACLAAGGSAPGGCLVLGGLHLLQGWGAWFQGVPSLGVCSGGVPAPGGLLPVGGGGCGDPLQKQTAAVADGTHPTGMHSCFISLLHSANRKF